MPNITITNNTPSAIFINFLYVELAAGAELTVYRNASDLMAQPGLHQLMANNDIDVDIEYTAAERAAGFDIFPGFSLPEGEDPINGSPNVRYVDLNAPEGGDGTVLNPYQTIQEAIDELETLGPFSKSEPGVIYIEPGRYEESLIIHKPAIYLIGKMAEGRGRRSVQLISSGWALTCTNATPESLAAYDVSGDYGDLVNQGDAGPQDNVFLGIQFYGYDGVGNTGAIRLLGVKGDASPTTTNFGSSTAFYFCTTDGYPTSVFAKNAGTFLFYDNFCNRLFKLENSDGFEFYNTFVGNIEATYTASDPDGEHSGAAGGYGGYIYNSQIYGIMNPIIFDGGNPALKLMNNNLGFHSNPTKNTITFQNTITGKLLVYACDGAININLDGNTDLDVKASIVDGNISLGSGPGTATWDGGGFTGTFTDPDNKLVRATEDSGSKIVRGYIDVAEDPNVNGNFRRITGNITTTTNVLTAALAIPLEEGEVICATMQVVASRAGTAGHGVYRRRVMCYRDSGGSATLGTIQYVHTEEDVAGFNSDFGVSGNNLQINVLGTSGETVNWFASVEYTRVGL